MTVLPLTSYSDHKPLCLKVNLATRSKMTYKQLHEAYRPAPCRYKIDPDSHSDLSEIMSSLSTTQKADSILKTDFYNTTEKTYELSHQITKHLQEIADQCLRKSNPPRSKKSTVINKKNPGLPPSHVRPKKV